MKHTPYRSARGYLCVCARRSARGGSLGHLPNEADRIAAADAENSERDSRAQRSNAKPGISFGQYWPRLTGSPQLKQANEWTGTCSRRTGWRMRTWNPGRFAWLGERDGSGGYRKPRAASADDRGGRMVAKPRRAVRGPVVYFDAKKKEEFAKFHGKLKGAIVIYQEHRACRRAKERTVADSAADAGASAGVWRAACAFTVRC